MSRIGFLIIGAQKAGSTSLFEYIRRHPQIYMPAEKELYFFNVDRAYRNGWERYRMNMLGGAPSGAVCGEATAEYMGSPYHDDLEGALDDADVPVEEIIPRRIKNYLPEIKLICVLRDPVMRAYSHYQMATLDRAETRTFGEAVGQLIEPDAIERSRAESSKSNGYIVNGEYGRLLAGYLRVFARDQLLVIFSDELAQEPEATLAKAFQFAGVDADFVPDNLNTRYRTMAVRQRIRGLNLFTWQTKLATFPALRALWHNLPQPIRLRIDRVYNVLGYHVGLWNRRSKDGPDREMPAAVRDALAAHFRPDGEALGVLLGREIPWLERPRP